MSGSRRQGWEKLAAKRGDSDEDLVDLLTRSREDVMSEWGAVRRQVWLLSVPWAVGALLLAMRLIYDTVIGYGWGWQMFS